MHWFKKKIVEQKLKRSFKRIFKIVHKKTGKPYNEIAIETIKTLNEINDGAHWDLTITNRKTKEIIYSSENSNNNRQPF